MPVDGSDAEVVRHAHLTGVNAVSQDLRRATSFSNRRQQERCTPYERAGKAVNAIKFARSPGPTIRVGFLPASALSGLFDLPA
ncbi:hypothetical protein Scel_14810 [Streptomyces cellostaticus]|nr:hypothetical protein Scel_14810 [Streptomyces cellostaticus]